jgi:hypothetical protein
MIPKSKRSYTSTKKPKALTITASWKRLLDFGCMAANIINRNG